MNKNFSGWEPIRRDYPRRSSVFILALFACVLYSTSLVAQEETGSVSGIVSHPTGALVPGAQISAAYSSNFSKSGISDPAGLYILQLPPGEYQLQASAPGFETSKPITVRVVSGQTIRHDIRLELAVVNQEILVSETSTPDTEPTNNASAITIDGSGLDSLADDPEDLSDDLIWP